MNAKDGCIGEIKFYGDFFGNGEIEELEEGLRGAALDQNLTQKLEALQSSYYMNGITAEELEPFDQRIDIIGEADGIFFGICEWSLPVSGPLAIRLAKEAGFDGNADWRNRRKTDGLSLNHKSVQEIYRETAQKYDLKLHSLNLGALLSEGTMNYAEGTTKGEWARKSLVKGF